jgi:cellulose synthase/poly-beta-1,6-N-acetylglucosamine synthase-like glycosyltransferase
MVIGCVRGCGMEYGGEPRPRDGIERITRGSLESPRARTRLVAPQTRRPLSEFPEIECIRRHMPIRLLAAAERRARDVGVTLDRVLVTAGLISEETYLRRLAANLGFVFEPLDGVPRAHCPLDDARLLEAAATGLLPLRMGNELTLVVAPRGATTRRLTSLARSPELRARIRLTTGERLRAFVAAHGAHALGERAAAGLRASMPRFSAATASAGAWRRWACAVSALAAGWILAPDFVGAAVGVGLAGVFVSWAVLRLAAAMAAPMRQAKPVRLADSEVPVYTIIVALYQEAAAAKGLIAALDALDYPPEKLDIKLVLELDDARTWAALESMRLGVPYELVTAPAVGPRTKPKALNAALAFARGRYIAVYDAEDRPEPDQLRHALAAFRAGGDRLACVQARLTIDNTADNWLTRLFTAEYAGLYDVFLPGLARHALPLPLGGSSNHFDAALLRSAGAWDPYNVTEDADLGMRLARLGYRTTVIASTTYEEAPAKIGAWMKQRSRWMKGWMQTWRVHMRSPVRLWHELGAAGFVTFQLAIGGTVVSALVHPLFLALLGWRLAANDLPPDHGAALTALYGGAFISGYVASAALALMGLARRRLLASAWIVLLMPVHWLMLSAAAWHALIRLLRDPHHWDKTEHGLARTSRSQARG